MPELELSGAKVFYTEDGAGQDVLLLHSGGSSSSQWRGMAPRLGAGHRLIAPDFFGHGKTDPWPGPAAFSQDDQADLVAAVMEKACTAPVNIVGHSFGGAVAIRLALRRPEWVSRLALIEPILPTLLKAPEPALFEEYLEVAGGFIAAAEDNQPARAWAIFLDYRNGAGTWERMGEATRNRFLGQTDQAADGFKSNLACQTTLEDCAMISQPTLILCGAETTEPDAAVTRILRSAIPGAAYSLIEGAGHMSPLTHPEAVADLVAEHL